MSHFGGAMNNQRETRWGVFLLAVALLLPSYGIAQVDQEDEAKTFNLKREYVQLVQTAPADTSKKIDMGLRFSLSGGFLAGINHINDHYEGWNAWYTDFASVGNTLGYSLDFIGPLDPLRFASFGGMEFFVNFKPYLGFGLGVGYLMGKKISGPVGVDGYFSDSGTNWLYMIKRTFTQKISAIPVHLTVYSGFPLGKMIRIVPYFGVGLYLGRFTFEESYEIENTWEPWEEDGFSTWTVKDATAFGFHGGLNIEYLFDQNFGLFFGIGGISASFEDLVGDLEWEYEAVDYWGNLSGGGTDKDLKLWFLEEQGIFVQDKWYPLIFLTEENPNSWSGVRNVETGKISLSQFRFIVGIVIHFNQ